jgi:hypothetical protein
MREVDPMGAEHRHRWTVIDFVWADDRPLMRQACACGAARTVPAWDRSWQPDATPSASVSPSGDANVT